MSVNGSLVAQDDDAIIDGIFLQYGECLLLSYDGCKIQFDSDDAGMEEYKKGKRGLVLLTTHRIILQCRNANGFYLSVPFQNLRDFDVEQPVFGANNISGTIIACAEAGLSRDTTFRIWFNKGGAIDFSNSLFETVQRGRTKQLNGPPSYVESFANAPPPYPGTAVAMHAKEAITEPLESSASAEKQSAEERLE